jgi:hypothetical protein
MDIHFNCPRCNQHLAVDRAGAGMTVNCPNCKGQIEIPLDSAQQAPNVSVTTAKPAAPATLFFAIFAGIVLAGAVLIFCWQHFIHTSPSQPDIRTSPSQPDRNDPFAEEERKDLYELLKADSRIQENLPDVISYFRAKQDDDPSSIQAQTHQKIIQLCEELSTIVPKIIAAKADNSVSGLISRQREIFKSFDAILAAEHTAEMETRLHVGEYAAELIGIDREYNQKVLAMLNQ